MFRRVILPLAALLLTATAARAQADSVLQRLMNAPVQEKVYLHTDNSNYFIGDTLWYKAYVVKAGDLTPTDMSRVLYVELVSPEGFVVNRQTVIVAPDGHSCGDIPLDQLPYSGYYELRAYTRWMLNFDVTEHHYNRIYREEFYNRQMASDFFREYNTVWSRVVPVYEKPWKAGDYTLRDMQPRPRQRAVKPPKPSLTVTFYPEGGSRVAGSRQRIAFEAINEQGEGVNVTGTIGGQTITADYQGRGRFTIDDTAPRQASFTYQGKRYTFDLPQAQATGVALTLDNERAQVQVTGQNAPTLYAIMLCRGVLKDYGMLHPDDHGQASFTIDTTKLPTGVCDLSVITAQGKPLASRLFFVNHHDFDRPAIHLSGLKEAYAPYECINLQVEAPQGVSHVSLAVVDTTADETTYDTGNMLTDLLLTSDVRGFIPQPSYYFERDDSLHRARLDLLLMVQGWRRYDVADLLSAQPHRYQPETALTVDGQVYRAVVSDPIEPEELPWWRNGIFGWTLDDIRANGEGGELKDYMDAVGNGTVMGYLADKDKPEELRETRHADVIEGKQTTVYEKDEATSQEEKEHGVDHGGLSHEVRLTGELVMGTDVWQIDTLTTHGGQFTFTLEPFYGDAILMLGAQDKTISKKKKKQLDDYDVFNEDAWPEYYVKRNIFYPVFARKYSFYQTHQPGQTFAAVADSDSLMQDTQHLDEVTVKARRRRGRQGIDWDRPVYTQDAIELYNLATDYGLSYGKVNFRRLPFQLSMLLVGNYNTDWLFHVDARLDRYLFYRNYGPDEAAAQADPMNRSNWTIYKNLKLKRLSKVKFYTDFSLRDDEPPEMGTYTPDVVVDFELMPQDATRYTMRDRRLVLHGFALPDDFYQPDYSHRTLPTAPDYRRTRYWNANLPLDASGRATVTFYNGSSATALKATAAGVGAQGPVSSQ